MTTTTESTKAVDSSLQLETDDQSEGSSKGRRHHRDGTSWLSHVFRPFLLPLDGVIDESQADDHFDWRFLGVSSLKSSTYGISEVSFFQVSGNTLTKQKAPFPSGPGANPTFTTSPSTCGVSTMTDEGVISNLSQQHHQHSETNGSYGPSAYTKQIIVIALNTQVFKPSKRQLYYIFPCDAIVETVNETPPYELYCSFHILNVIPDQKFVNNPSSVTTNNISSLNNQQGYTDIPSSSLLLSTTSDIKAEQSSIPTSTTTEESSIIQLSLTGISQDLYRIIKESVAGFETAYGKMIQLMKFHTEGMSNRYAELLVINGGNGNRSKKSTVETKPNKGKRKGSYQPRQTSPRTATATTVTPTTSNLSNKAKSVDNDAPKEPMTSPPMPSYVATPSNSAPIIPSGTNTTSANTTTSNRNNSANGNGRKCHYCGSKSTPMWRRGPDGAGTLCNACGVKWKHGKILCGKQSGPSSSDVALGSTTSPTPTVTKSANGYSAKGLTAKEQKKRKQHVELKIKKDKRIKIKEQQQQQRLKQQNSHSWHGNGTILDSMMETDDEDEDDDDDDDDDEDDDQNGIGSSGFSDDDDDDFMAEYDEDEDERMNHNIVAARHLTIHENQQNHHHHHRHHPYHNTLSTGSAPQSQSRSRSMTTSAANDYMSFQQQQHQHQHQYQQQQQQQQYQQNGWTLPNGFHHDQHQQHQHQQQSYPYQQQREEQQHRPRRHTADISVLDQVPWGEFPLSMGVDAVEAATVLTLLKRS